VGTSQLVDLNVTTGKIAADAITEAKIADGAVESEHLNNNVISGQTALTSEPADTDEFLVSDAGTIKRIDYSLIKGGGAFEKISTTTISSSVATVDFDISSTDYQDFRIIISGLVVDTHQTQVLFKVKRSGQSSFDGGSGEYRWNAIATRSQDGATINNSSNSDNKLIFHGSNLARDASVDGATLNSIVDIPDPHGTTNTKFIYAISAFVEGVYGTSAVSMASGYRYDTSETALIGLQLGGAGSTEFTSGTVTLYGRKN